jgi:hypothetical protein
MATRSVSKKVGAAARKPSGSRRRRAHKPKFIEIQGRKLTAAQYREYENELNACIGRHPGDSLERSQARALSDVIFRLRPSVKAYKRFESMVLWRRANEAFSALGGLKNLNLWTGDVELVGLYNAVIGRIATEFRAVGEELASIHGAIVAETREMRSRGAP